MRYIFCCVAALATFYAPMLSATGGGDHPVPHVASGTEHYEMMAHPEGGIQLNEQARQAFNAIHHALPAHLKPRLDALAKAGDDHAESMQNEMAALRAQHASSQEALIQAHGRIKELINQHHAKTTQMINDHYARLKEMNAQHHAALRDERKAHYDFVRELMKKKNDPAL